MTRYDDQRLAELLAALEPAPESWVLKAERIPAEHGMLKQILAKAGSDAGFRRALLEDVEGTLEQAGYARDPDTVQTVRWHLRLGQDS